MFFLYFFNRADFCFPLLIIIPNLKRIITRDHILVGVFIALHDEIVMAHFQNGVELRKSNLLWIAGPNVICGIDQDALAHGAGRRHRISQNI